jgi:hypothetical protein
MCATRSDHLALFFYRPFLQSSSNFTFKSQTSNTALSQLALATPYSLRPIEWDLDRCEKHSVLLPRLNPPPHTSRTTGHSSRGTIRGPCSIYRIGQFPVVKRYGERRPLRQRTDRMTMPPLKAKRRWLWNSEMSSGESNC